LVETEKAYLAGIIDGEGTITLSRRHPDQTPSPNVSISNSSLQMLKWVKRHFGGWISKKRTYKAHHRQTYVWGITHNKAIDLLKLIEKHLIIKKPQARLILSKYKAVTVRTGKYTAAQLKRKMDLVAKIRLLNQR
jgi:hypothetical protein